MIKKIIKWVGSKVWPYVAPFHRIKPDWLKYAVNWFVGHALLPCGLAELGFRLGGGDRSWSAVIGAVVGYLAGLAFYYYKENYVEASRHDPAKAMDKFGDQVGPTITGFLYLWFIAWRMLG